MSTPAGNGHHQLDLGGFASYEDAKLGLRLRHPADWVPEPGRFGAAVAFTPPQQDLEPGSFLPSASVLVADVGDEDLEDLSEQSLQALLAALDEPVVLQAEDVDLGPHPARRHVVVHRRGALELVLEQWVLVHRRRMATLSVTCEREDFETVHPVGAAMAAELRLR